MNIDSKIFVAGSGGLVGSALVRRLRAGGYANLLTPEIDALDLTDQTAVAAWFARERPEYVFLAAARVGGIHANNTYPAEFIFSNLVIQNNVIHQAYLHSVKRLLFLGSSCIYPKLAAQPMQEAHLLTGVLEPTNEPYAIAKIAGLKMCEAYNRQYGTRFVAVMPTNLYGPGDNFHPENSHVLPALVRRFHEAKAAVLSAECDKTSTECKVLSTESLTTMSETSEGHSALSTQHSALASVVVWGSGTPMREFLFVDDMADGCLFLMELDEATLVRELCSYPKPNFVNLGTGVDVTIRELAEMVRTVVGFAGGLEFDSSKPDGTPRKLLDVSRMTSLGWTAKTGLREGIAKTYAWFLEHQGDFRK